MQETLAILLLLVPRLSLILSLVVLMLALAVSVLDYLGLTPSARAVILPLVILTMMIERFHITAEESGLRRSLVLLALAFPEGLLFVGAPLILVGRYSGSRLTELWRFRDLAREGEA
ncbi:MAG: 7TM domain-containing protein [Planctomycetota bacterium]